MSSPPLRLLIEQKRVLVTVGAGGVGKTTTAAALAVAAATQGRRVLCLTIDPAKRLAESLGIPEMPSEAAVIDPARFVAAGLELRGSLTVMMLDMKRTFDELVIRTATSKEAANRVLKNRLYQYMSTSLAGTQEYMAMEKLAQVKADARYDLIVLDTPPTTNALDFLDAPERLVGALDSAALKYFLLAFQSSGRFSLNLLARSASLVLQAIGKLTGRGFLEEMAELISDLSILFGSFRERASYVQQAFRGDDVAFVLVTSPAPMSLKEVVYFAERLEEHNMSRGAFVVNRVRTRRGAGTATDGDVRVALDESGLRLESGASQRVLQAFEEEQKLAERDLREMSVLGPFVARGVPLVPVPELASDVRDLRLLGVLASRLTS